MANIDQQDKVQELLLKLGTLETNLGTKTSMNSNYRRIVNENLPQIRDKIRAILEKFNRVKSELDALRNVPAPAPVIDEEAMRRLQQQHEGEKQQLQNSLNDANRANEDAQRDLENMRKQIAELQNTTETEKARLLSELERARGEASQSISQVQQELENIRIKLDAANQTISTMMLSINEAIVIINRISTMIDTIISEGDIGQLEGSLNEINTLLNNALTGDNVVDFIPKAIPSVGPNVVPSPSPVATSEQDAIFSGRNILLDKGFNIGQIRALDVSQMNKLANISDQATIDRLRTYSMDKIIDELNKIRSGGRRTQRRRGAFKSKRTAARRKTTRKQKQKQNGGYLYKAKKSSRRSTTSPMSDNANSEDGVSANYRRVRTRKFRQHMSN